MIRFSKLVVVAAPSLVTLPALAAPPDQHDGRAAGGANIPILPPETATAGEVDLPPATPAPDSLSGHLQLGVGPALALPFARLDNETTFQEAVDGAYGLTADVGMGVSRSVVLGGYFQYLRYEADERCAGCDPSALGFGAFVRYHLVQGVRFDPWISAGAGFRTFDTGSVRYSGIEWLRVAIGGDWYALSQFGFGPYVELDLGTFTDRPDGTDAAVFATFGGGLRLAFDVQGK